MIRMHDIKDLMFCITPFLQPKQETSNQVLLLSYSIPSHSTFAIGMDIREEDAVPRRFDDWLGTVLVNG